MQLRPYQTASVQALRDGMADGHIRQILCASTGAGKSIIMLSMIKSARDKGRRVLIICERRILVEQFSAHLDSAGIEHGVLMASHWRWRASEKIQVASAQTLERMESMPMFDVCFIDEVHAAMRKSIIQMIKNFPNMRIVGATATPYNPKLKEHFSSITNVVTMRELVNDGHLVPFRVFAAREIDTSGLKTAWDGEFEKKGLEVKARQIAGDVVSDYIRLTHEIFGEQRKGIVFSCGIAHGTELAEKFCAAGVIAVQISSDDTDEFKKSVLDDFKKPDSDIKLVISSEILERGFDQSDVYFVILAKAIKKSFSKFVQMIGRGARLHESKGFCVIQDHASNWLRFSEQWEELYHEGCKELSGEQDRKEKKEPTKKQKENAKCPKCGILNGGSPCKQCGHIRPTRNEVVTLPGEMQEIDTAKKTSNQFSSDYKKAFYQGLLFVARSKKYADGWAFHAYKEKFEEVSPKWEKVAIPPNDAVKGFITHRNIKAAWSRK